MWAIFCTFNEAILPGGWRRFLRVGPVIVAQQVPDAAPLLAPAEEPAPEEAPEPAAPPRGGQLCPHRGDVPACPCCYYTTSVLLGPDDPNYRTCGWFTEPGVDGWIWWHGQAPHAPFPYLTGAHEAPATEGQEPADDAQAPVGPADDAQAPVAPAEEPQALVGPVIVAQATAPADGAWVLAPASLWPPAPAQEAQGPAARDPWADSDEGTYFSDSC